MHIYGKLWSLEKNKRQKGFPNHVLPCSKLSFSPLCPTIPRKVKKYKKYLSEPFWFIYTANGKDWHKSPIELGGRPIATFDYGPGTRELPRCLSSLWDGLSWTPTLIQSSACFDGSPVRCVARGAGPRWTQIHWNWENSVHSPRMSRHRNSGFSEFPMKNGDVLC